MYGRCGDAECGLRSHTCLGSPLDAGDDVANIIQSTEYTCDINALSVFYLVHELSNIIRHSVHTKGVKSAVKHVCLDAYLIKGLTESTNGIIGVFASQQVYLFKGTAIGFNTGKATHVDNDGSDALQLVFAGLKFTRRLPHVTIYETELNFLFHILSIYVYDTILFSVCLLRNKPQHI